MATPEEMYPNGKDNMAVLRHGQEDGTRWAPAEADVSIRPGWFYHDYEAPKTPEELFDIYLTSVGRGGTLLLNLTPDRRGRIPDEDIESLMAWREMVDNTFRNDLAANALFMATSSRGRGFEAENMQGEDERYWATADGVTTGDITLKWSEPITAKYIVVQEHIALGQRVREFVIEAFDGDDWQEIASGTTIGYKRILPLADSVTTDQLRIRLLDSRAELAISRIAIY